MLKRVLSSLTVIGLGLLGFGVLGPGRARPCPVQSCGPAVNEFAFGLGLAVLGFAALIAIALVARWLLRDRGVASDIRER